MKKTSGILRIGTSGIVVPGNTESRPTQYADKSRLTYYASLFNTVEINSTFRKTPRLSTFEKWRDEVPVDFKITVKLLKDFTHVKKLEIALENLEAFLEAANHVGDKKGSLLIQFPGSITSEYFERVQQLLDKLHQLDRNNNWLKAVELRSTTWYNNDTYRMLRSFRASMVLHDMPKSNNLSLEQEFPFFYLRYHGPKGDYRGSYTDAFLQEQADKIRPLLAQGKDVYVYFNNTMGQAYDNAMYLKAALKDN